MEFEFSIGDWHSGRMYHCLVTGWMDVADPGDEETPPAGEWFNVDSVEVIKVEICSGESTATFTATPDDQRRADELVDLDSEDIQDAARQHVQSLRDVETDIRMREARER